MPAGNFVLIMHYFNKLPFYRRGEVGGRDEFLSKRLQSAKLLNVASRLCEADAPPSFSPFHENSRSLLSAVLFLFLCLWENGGNCSSQTFNAFMNA